MDNTEEHLSVKQRGLAYPEAEVHRVVSINVPGEKLRTSLHQDRGQPMPQSPLTWTLNHDEGKLFENFRTGRELLSEI